MRDAFIAILLVAGFTVEVYILIYILPREISAWRSGDSLWTALRVRKSWRSYRKRLRSPKPFEVEEKLGALLPSRLVALYRDTKTILENEFQVLPQIKYSEAESFYIAEFLPLDARSLKDVRGLSEFGTIFCFASDGCGNYFWVSLDKIRQKDSNVWQFYHDDGKNIKVADSLEEFLSWPRYS